jgi:hypothetical protein
MPGLSILHTPPLPLVQNEAMRKCAAVTAKHPLPQPSNQRLSFFPNGWPECILNVPFLCVVAAMAVKASIPVIKVKREKRR